MIGINVNQLGIFVIPNYRFCTQIFHLQKYFTLSIFDNVVSSKAFTFIFCCAMPRWSPVRDIRCPAYRVKYFEVACIVILWCCGFDGYLWVHPSAFINILPGSENISTTIQTPEVVVVRITLSWSNFLVGLDNGSLNSRVFPIFCVSPEWVCDTHQESCRPSYFSYQLDLIRLFHTRHQIPRDTFPEQSVQ